MTDGDALFVNPSSLAVPLIALGAKATIVGPKGERTVPVEDLYQVPKTEKDRELTLAPGELLTKVIDPGGQGEERLVRGAAEAGPRLAARAGVGQPDDGRRQGLEARGSWSTAWRPIPWRSEAAEKAIAGKAITMETAAAAGEAAIEGAKPLSMNAYKVGLTKTVVKRALLAAAGNRYWEG